MKESVIVNGERYKQIIEHYLWPHLEEINTDK